MDIQRVGTTKDKLGEAILWDQPSSLLYWADAMGGVIHRLDVATGVCDDFHTPPPIGALCITESGRILLNLSDGAYFFDPLAQALEPYALLAGAPARTRLNDSKIDRQGRMVLGGLYLDYKTDDQYAAKFYTLNADRVFRPFDNDVGITNGPCFSPAGDILYIADTARRIIWAFDYDLETGKPTDKRLFADDTLLQGMPDGSTVDAEGFVWFTVMSRSVLVRISPAGQLVQTIEMPVKPTSVAFGGANLDVLYVTSISQSVNVPITEADAGGLFAITGLGVEGLADVRFVT